MFDMTIRTRGGSEIASGRSLAGEDWKATLLRLFQADINDGRNRGVLEPARPFFVDGLPMVTIVAEAGPVGGMMHPAHEVLVETDPPQIPSS